MAIIVREANYLIKIIQFFSHALKNLSETDKDYSNKLSQRYNDPSPNINNGFKMHQKLLPWIFTTFCHLLQ